MTYILLSKGTLAELPVLERFQDLGYEVRASPKISPGGERPERKSYIESVLKCRLHAAMARRNPHLPDGRCVDFSLGQPNELQAKIIEELRGRFCSDVNVMYRGNTARKLLYVNENSNQV